MLLYILFPNLFTFKQKLKASVHPRLLLMYSGLKKREANKRGGCFTFIAIAFLKNSRYLDNRILQLCRQLCMYICNHTHSSGLVPLLRRCSSTLKYHEDFAENDT